MGARANRSRTALCAALALLAVPASAGASTIYTVDNASPPVLQTFDSATPGSLTTLGPITGMLDTERMTTIDFDPSGGGLYGLGSGRRLYRIDTTTLVATPLSPAPITLSPTGADALDMDFDPVTGLIRVVTDSRQNVRVSTVTGKAQSTDDTLHAGDGTTSATPQVVGIAYNKNLPGATTSALYGYEFSDDQVVTLGTTNGPTPPELGTIYLVGDSGVTAQQPTSRVGMDGAPDGTIYVSLVVGGLYRLYSVNFAHMPTPELTLVNTIGNGLGAQRDIAVAPTTNEFSFSAASYAVDESAGSVTVTVSRGGPLLGTARATVVPADGTAAAPGDYLGGATTLDFAAGEASKSATIPIGNDVAVEDDETVQLSLQGISGGRATLGTPGSATLTIHSDDVAAAPPPPLPDTTPPTVSLSVPKARTLKQLLKGLTAGAEPGEPAALDFDLLARARSATVAAADNLVLAHKSLALAAGARTVKLKPGKKLLGKQRRSFKVRVRVVATDAAGNRSAPLLRTVAVKVPRPKRRR
jgi:hypothetical protein